MITQTTIRLKERARELGFTMVGVIPAAPGKRLQAYLDWIAQGQHGQMGYMARPDRVLRRKDPSAILNGIRSIVCVGLDYYTRPVPEVIAGDPSRGRFSNYAWGGDYHNIMEPKLEKLAEWLQEDTNQAVASRIYVDTGAILERDHAETAGLGFTGKNTMLLAPRAGSFFFLGELLTTAKLAPDPAATKMPTCGRCTRCLDACPTNAFPQPYVLDARRCISYLTIELKGWIPRHLRPLMGNWVYGCDVCQEVCPFNRFARPTAEAAFEPVGWGSVAPPLVELLGLDEAGFEARFAGTPIRRIRRARLLRNACVATGNWGSQEAVPLLTTLLQDAEPLIRGHAAWALGQIGGKQAKSHLIRALSQETDEQARHELAAAL